MDDNRCFFANVCRRLVCAVFYFNRVRISSFAVYTYQHVIVTLDVVKWTWTAATEFKRTESLSKCILNIIQSEKVDKVAVLNKSS